MFLGRDCKTGIHLQISFRDLIVIVIFRLFIYHIQMFAISLFGLQVRFSKVQITQLKYFTLLHLASH